jgi:hypothetical protein
MGMEFDDGTLTLVLSGGAAGILIPASDFVASAAGPALVVIDAIHHSFGLDSAAAESVSVGLWIPPKWNAVDMFFYGHNVGAGAGGVCLGYYIEDVTDGYSLTTETPTVANGTTFTAKTQDLFHVVTGPTRVAVAPDTFHTLKVGRLPAEAGDTLANDWGLMGVRLRRAG